MSWNVIVAFRRGAQKNLDAIAKTKDVHVNNITAPTGMQPRNQDSFAKKTLISYRQVSGRLIGGDSASANVSASAINVNVRPLQSPSGRSWHWAL
jgi:hypothetical protein